jgi:hypothetical protein
MGSTHCADRFEELLDLLVAQALERDVAADVAEQARHATARAVRSPHGTVSPQTRRRAEAYFAAVVRRRAVRRDASPRAAARFVVATVVEDLRSSGRSPSDIWDELQRGWASEVPGDVLEEYRLRLVG